MGRKSTRKDKTPYQIAREAAGLTREKAAEVSGISATQIARIEGNRAFPHPYDVMAMAKAYKAPWLCNHFCSKECEVGKKYVDTITLTDLTRVVMEILNSLNNLAEKKDCLIRLAADGKITDSETGEFYRILTELDRISDLTDALKLWNETMVAEGKMRADTKKKA